LLQKQQQKELRNKIMYSKHFKCFDGDDLLDDDVADDVDKIVQVHVLEDLTYTILPTGFRVIDVPGKAPTPVMQVCTSKHCR
jgi:hypothetical protein